MKTTLNNNMKGMQYLQVVSRVLTTTDASERNWYGSRHKLPYGVPHQFVGNPIIGPQCITVTYQVRDEDWAKVSKLEERFAMMSSSQFVRVYRDRGVVRTEFTLPYSEWREVHLSDLPHRRDTATIGQRTLGTSARIGWDPPHKVVFGSTQTGKSVCLVDFILSLSRHSSDDYKFLILNPKNDPKFDPFARLPHLAAPIACNTIESVKLLRFALAEKDKRVGNRERQVVRWVMFVDEVAQLVIEQPEASEAIVQLGQFAGGLNMNLVLASQAANPAVFGNRGSLAKANLGSRLVFQLPRDQAFMATGLQKQHPERLGGKGDALAIRDGNVTRFRAALPQDRDYADLFLTESPPSWPEEDQIAGSTGAVAKWQIDPNMLAYALVKRGRDRKVASAYALRNKFGGAMDTARMVRDYADELLGAVKGLQNERV